MRAQPCTHTHTCVHTHTRSTDAGTMPPSPASLPVLVGDTVHPSTAQPPVPEDEAVHPSHVPLAYALIVTAPASLAAPALLPAPPATCSLPWPFAQILHSPFKTTTHTSMGTGPAKHLPVAGSDTTIQRPSVGTISLHPRGGHGRCERGCLAQVAGDWPDCAGLEVWGLHSPVLSGQAGPTHGQRHQEFPASLAVLYITAWGQAPACQGRDWPRVSRVPGPACTDAISQERGALQGRQQQRRRADRQGSAARTEHPSQPV